LYTALEFAAGTAEKAHQTELDTVLRPWIRNRLSSLLEPPGDSEDLHHFEQRVRHAVVICNRYRDTQYELFGDRHWNGKPEPKWICPDTDIALLAPFDGYCKGHAPTYALQLQEPQGATFTVVNFYRTAPISYVIALKPTPQLPKELATDPLCSQAVHDGLLALGITMKQPSTETEQQCPHQWPTHD
jgi:hypothetical protein